MTVAKVVQLSAKVGNCDAASVTRSSPIQGHAQLRRLCTELDQIGGLLGRRRVASEAEHVVLLSQADATAQRAILHNWKRELKRVRTLAEQGRRSALQNAAGRLLESFTGRAVSLIREAATDRRVHRLDEIEARAAKLKLDGPIHDPVRLIERPKDSGGVRPILSFGWRHRSQQLIFSDVMLAAGVASDYEYSCATRGAQAFIRTVSAAMQDSCYFWVTADIKDCFASVKPGHLHGWMPLKASVWEGIIYLPENVPIIACDDLPTSNKSGDHLATLEGAVQCGLPQGSALSPQIASALIGREIRAVMHGRKGVALSYCDDIAIGVRTLKEAEEIRTALGERFNSLSAGPLLFKFSKVTSALSGVEIIGRKIRYKCWEGEWKVHVTPSEQSFQRLLIRVEKRFPGGVSGAVDHHLDQLHNYIRNWAKGLDWQMPPDWEEAVVLYLLTG